MSASHSGPEGVAALDQAEPDLSDQTSTSNRRSASLDAVRAIACAMVVVSHVSLYRGDSAFLGLRNGVMLFFALSGYLLFRPFLTGRVGLRSYTVHRAARILPAYAVALVGVTILTGDRSFIDNPLVFALFLQNYDRDLWQGFLGVSWTLVLEVQFYITLPILALLIGRSVSRLLLLAVGSYLIGLIGALLGADRFGLSSYPFMIWAFAPGMLVAIADVRGARWPAHPTVLVAGVVLLVLGTAAPWFSLDIASGIGAGLVVAWCVTRRPSLGAVTRFGTVGAALTYSSYLWHVDLIKATTSVPAAILATLAIAALIYVTVERPVIKRGRLVGTPNHPRTHTAIAPTVP